MKDNLKPCPFCGGEAECKTNYVYGKSHGHFVYCTKCQITQDKVYATKTYAIKKWNRRVEMKDNYKIERRGEYYCLLNNGKVEYKSKDKQKVQSRYDRRKRAQENQFDREIRARNYRWI